MRAWGTRGHVMRTAYDALQRPAQLFVTQTNAAEVLAERAMYGESAQNPEASNLRGKLFQHFDGAGVSASPRYDFKGNPLESTRQLAQDYKNTLDWSQRPALESEVFRTRTTFDALNRPVTVTTPDNSVLWPVYNEANLLERLDANLRGSQTATSFVTNIDYNARGQRVLVEYGNNVKTEYEYDRETFRLRRLTTTRRGFAPSERIVQDLSYTYDPVGNITHIQDDADIQN